MMNRGYTREWYLQRVEKIREILGEDCGLSSDMITGFCTETDQEHIDTLTLMDIADYDYSYMFHYSERPGTLAEKKFTDDISQEVKQKRLAEIIKKQNYLSLKRNQQDIGKIQKVLIEGTSKRSNERLQGRNSANKVVIFPKENKTKGEYVFVQIESCTGGTLMGSIVTEN
jgi:tRNA-2-methylthio-N6-dimethylallyladenosine synthase